MELAVPVKNIIIAVDFSEQARNAFRVGLSLRSTYQAKAWLLHVSEPIRAFNFESKRYIETQETVERLEHSLRLRLDAFYERCDVRPVGRELTQILIRSGKAADRIIETAIDKEADLIVLGASGNRPTQQGLAGMAYQGVGSTAYDVVRHAPCTVLCVRLPDPSEPSSIIRGESSDR